MSSTSRTILTCPACNHSGHITLLRVGSRWGCVRCYGAVNCSSCEKRLSNGARHDLCRACRYPLRPEKHCSRCGVKVNAKQNKSGICRPCRCAMNRSGETNLKRMARLAVSNRDPVLIERRLVTHTPTPPIRRKAPPPKVTAFERAMERVRNGAGISIVHPIRRPDPTYTLGGVSDL